MIGIIDSGFGGLSVVAELFRQQKNIPFVYLGDNLNNPYGTKSKETITKCATDLIDYLIDNYNIHTLCIACNTICAASLPQLKQKYPNLHIEAIANYGASAALMSFAEQVTVLATNFTIESNLYQTLIHQYNPNINVQQLPAQQFVAMVENDNIDCVAIQTIVKQIAEASDMVILGCTHFPFLYPQLRKLIPAHIQIIDPAISIVATWEYDAIKHWAEQSIFLTTGNTENFSAFIQSHQLDVHNIPVKQIKL